MKLEQKMIILNISLHIKYHWTILSCIAVRTRGGWCVNPTPRHFSAAYKKLLAHHQIKASVVNIPSSHG